MSDARQMNRRRALLALAGNAFAVAALAWSAVGAAAMPEDQAFSSAASVVIQLQAAQPSMTLLTDYSQSTDTEHLLGLPGQYVARATFNDSLVSGEPTQVTGIVEVFSSQRDLATRLRSVVRPPGEQDFPSGPVLVRVFGVEDPVLLAAYQSAVKQVVLT